MAALIGFARLESSDERQRRHEAIDARCSKQPREIGRACELHSLLSFGAKRIDRTQRQARHNVVLEHVARNDVLVRHREVRAHGARASVRVAMDRYRRQLYHRHCVVNSRVPPPPRLRHDRRAVQRTFVDEHRAQRCHAGAKRMPRQHQREAFVLLEQLLHLDCNLVPQQSSRV